MITPIGLLKPETMGEVLDALRQASDTARECARLRQILWDCYAACGADTDGDATAPPPGVLTPDVPELALAAVRELRRDCDAAYDEGRSDQLADDVRVCEDHGAFYWAEPRPCTCRRAGCALTLSPQVPVAPLLKEQTR